MIREGATSDRGICVSRFSISDIALVKINAYVISVVILFVVVQPAPGPVAWAYTAPREERYWIFR